jgi:hypothetical protein
VWHTHIHYPLCGHWSRGSGELEEEGQRLPLTWTPPPDVCHATCVLLSGDHPAAAAAELAMLMGTTHSLEVVAVRTVGALTHAQVSTTHTSPTAPHRIWFEYCRLRIRQPDAVVPPDGTMD